MGAAAPTPPSFHCAWLVLQMARYRGQRSAWQVGAAAPHPPLSAALGLSCRRLATAGNETLAILRGHLRTCKIIRCKGYNDEAFIVLIAAAALAIYRSRGETPRTPLYAALGFTFGGLAAAGNERDHGSSVKFLASVHECSGSWD